jgi:hypothetical protein
MNTYTNNLRIQENSLMVRNAIEMITGEELKYATMDENIFTVCDISVKIGELTYKVKYGAIENTFVNKKDLLSFILVSTTKEEGLGRLSDRCLNLDQMSQADQKHIRRLCNFQLFGTNKYDLYARILYSNTKPSELSKQSGITERLIINIRKINRKAILISIINELMTNHHTHSAA